MERDENTELVGHNSRNSHRNVTNSHGVSTYDAAATAAFAGDEIRRP